MALTSNSFNSQPGMRTLGTQDKVDMENVLKSVLLKDTALLGKIPMKGAAKNTEHKWMEDSMNAVTFQCNAVDTVTSSTNIKMTITSPSTNAKVQQVLRKDAVIYPENGEWYGRFTTTPVTGSNAVAIHGNSTARWGTCAAGTKFYVASLPKRDADSASDDISKARTQRKNFTQVFERGIKIEKTREHIDLYAVDSELALQTKRRTEEVKRELGMAIINGMAYHNGTSFTDVAEYRSLAGIIQLIRDPDLDGGTLDDTTVVQASCALSATKLNELVKKMFDLGGFPDDHNCIMVLGATQAQKFSALEQDRLRGDKSNKTRGIYANKFISDLGIEMDVILDRWVPNDKVLIIDLNRIRVMPLQGDSWALEEKASTGRSRNFQLSGQYTLVLENADACHGLIYDLTT